LYSCSLYYYCVCGHAIVIVYDYDCDYDLIEMEHLSG
jgi:hypothetical protein